MFIVSRLGTESLLASHSTKAAILPPATAAANPGRSPAPPHTTGAIPHVSVISPAQTHSVARAQARRPSRPAAARSPAKAYPNWVAVAAC